MSGLLLVCIFLPLMAAPVAFLLDRRSAAWRDGFTTAVSLLTLALAAFSAAFRAEAVIPGFCGFGASFSVSGFRGVFFMLAAVAFPLSALSAHAYFVGEKHVGRYQAFFLVTFGALLGVFASADLFTTYVFFEMMSLSSWVWVAQEETGESKRAADTYLAIAIVGGLALLYGIFELYALLGTLDFAELRECAGASQTNPRVLVAGFCLLVGFGAKAGMYPLHIWLPKAHPVAPAPASALLSGILTKAGVFGVLICVSGLYLGDACFAIPVLVLGVVTMLLGAVLALCSNNLKRTLACSSLSQIGFILVACGVLGLDGETSLAAGGAVLHAVNHALVKLVLFLSAGAIYKQNHTLDLNRLCGAGRGNLPLAVLFAVGMLSLAGVPGFLGYASKTLIHEAIVENAAVLPYTGLLRAVEWLFLLAGGMTLAYMGKLFTRLFLEKGDCAPVRLDAGTATAITVAAVPLVLLGVLPGRTATAIANLAMESLSAEPFEMAYFTLTNFTGAAVSITIGLALYALVVRFALTDRKTGLYRVVTSPVSLETHVYRPVMNVLRFLGALVARFVYSLTDWFVQLTGYVLTYGKSERWTPGRDDHFAHYSRKYVRFGRIRQTLAFELLLFGAGVVTTLLFLLLA